MLGKIISMLFGGGAAGAVAGVGKLLALAPLAWWLLEHKDEAAVTFTYGQLAVVGLVVFAFIEVAHVARAPGGPQG